MSRKMPTIINVEYQRAAEYERVKVPGAVWNYSIRSSDEDVYGFAGGLLVKTPAGNWIAHYWEYCSGDPASTREQAILNVLPLAAAIVDKHRADQKEFERVYEERITHACALGNLFPAGCGLVGVHDITAKHEEPSGEPRFKVTMTFDNLTEEQVIRLATQEREQI
jgi:hypothetical protein